MSHPPRGVGVSVDPDADLIEAMARANHEDQFAARWSDLHEEIRAQARSGARAALAVVREWEG